MLLLKNLVLSISALFSKTRRHTINDHSSFRSKSDGRESTTTIHGEGLCCVCLSRLKEGGSFRVLPCMHRFHRSCVDKWLMSAGRKTCPVCRFPVEDGGPPEKGKTEATTTEEMAVWFSSFHISGFM
nr:E3 ubiquitin-protein ligase RHA2A-like [Ipomoea batatas]